MSAAPAYPIKANGDLYDQAQVERYFSMLFGNVDWQPGQVASILGIGEKGTPREGVFRERQIIAPAFMAAAHGHLKRWAMWHAAGFVVPAVLHASAAHKGEAKLEEVAALTAIILDLDSGDVSEKAKYVQERLGRASMIVASGGKTDAGKLKAHCYWLFNEPCEDVERVAEIRKLLAAKVGGDQSFGRATQVVRIPGSVHAKNGVASLCRILDQCDAEYSFDDLAEIIEDMPAMPGIEPPKPAQLPILSVVGGMDFTPKFDTAVAALHRDVEAGGDELTRWGEFSKVAGFQIAEARAGRLSPQDAYWNTQGWMLQHMVPPWPQARFEQEFRGLFEKDIANHGPFPQSPSVRAEALAGTIAASPASWPSAQLIQPRQWLFGRWLQRGIVTAVIAPGGVGKSSLMQAICLSAASGKPILGKDVYGGPLTVWMWNLEDSLDNLARGRIAASIHHGVGEAQCGGRLFVDSGPEGMGLCIAVEGRDGFRLIEPVVEALIAEIRAKGIDILVIDPFVSAHAVNENDNNMVDAVAKAFSRVAMATGCAIVLVHHSVKTRGEAVTADSARGASALNNAARVTLVLNRMNQDQAELWSIDPSKASRYFSVADDKHNLSPAEQADWFELVSVSLNNGNDTYEADNVGVVTRWQPPRVMDGVEASDLFHIQRAIQAGTYWEDAQSKENWAGEVIANVLKLDVGDTTERTRIKGMLKVWMGSGALKVERVRDESKPKNIRHRNRVIVGVWAGDPNAAAVQHY